MVCLGVDHASLDAWGIISGPASTRTTPQIRISTRHKHMQELFGVKMHRDAKDSSTSECISFNPSRDITGTISDVNIALHNFPSISLFSRSLI